MGNDRSDDSKVQYLLVDEGADGQRIDNYLMTRLKGVPKSWVYRVLRKGEVRVNKGRAKPTRRLAIGDEVRIPPLRMAREKATKPSGSAQNIIEKSILYEDELLLVINKPSGIAVHGGSGVSHGVIETLRALRPNAPYLELAHRLDRDTSGCLLIAKKRTALQHLQKLQLSGKVDKYYLALTAGRWRKGKVTADAPLQKNTLRSGERVVRVDPQGKQAISHFEVRKKLGAFTLVQVKLETGRTHQIRVHAQHLGRPLVGDAKYGDEEINNKCREKGCKRLFLHASRLKFKWPDSGRLYQFEAPLPDELEHCLANLERRES